MISYTVHEDKSGGQRTTSFPLPKSPIRLAAQDIETMWRGWNTSTIHHRNTKTKHARSLCLFGSWGHGHDDDRYALLQLVALL